MTSFYSLLSYFTVDSFVPSEPGAFDMLTKLPLEVAINILRMLPGKDILNAALTSKKWLQICKSDGKLRQKIRRHFRQMRRNQLNILLGHGSSSRRRPRAVVEGNQRSNITNISNTPMSRVIPREDGLDLGRRYNSVSSRVTLCDPVLLSRPKKQKPTTNVGKAESSRKTSKLRL